MFGLPKVYYIEPELMWQHMGGVHIRGYYNAYDNIIYVNTLYGLSFWNLLHEFGHWLLCRLPHCDFVYYLNEAYDEVDWMLQRIR